MYLLVDNSAIELNTLTKFNLDLVPHLQPHRLQQRLIPNIPIFPLITSTIPLLYPNHRIIKPTNTFLSFLKFKHWILFIIGIYGRLYWDGHVFEILLDLLGLDGFCFKDFFEFWGGLGEGWWGGFLWGWGEIGVGGFFLWGYFVGYFWLL